MKKLILALAAFVLSASCSKWISDGGNEGGEIPATKIVDKLVMADGTEVRFSYESDYGLVSRIDWSNGRSISVSYKDVTTPAPTIYVREGAAEQVIAVANGRYMNIVYENDADVVRYDYSSNFIMRSRNSAGCSRSSYTWGGYSYPASQTNTWYADASSMDLNWIVRKDIYYSWSDASPYNVIANINLMPLVVPEFAECAGVDPMVIAALNIGGFRPGYLPVGLKIKTEAVGNDDDDESDDEVAAAAESADEEDDAEIRYYSYRRDEKGYIETVYLGLEGDREAMFSIVYIPVSSQTGTR